MIVQNAMINGNRVLAFVHFIELFLLVNTYTLVSGIAFNPGKINRLDSFSQRACSLVLSFSVRKKIFI